MDKQPYQYRFMPKVIMGGSFDFSEDENFKIATIVDDADILKKTASSPVVAEWGDIEPVKNASLIHLIALGAGEVTGANRNADLFKAAVLKEKHPTFKENGALYREHKNRDYSKREGDVIKTAYNDEMGRVELLVAANHDKCADWLGDIEKGDRVDFSMGWDCEYDVCEACGNKAKTRKEYCKCMKKSAGKILPDGRRVCVDNPAGYFNDISKVATGADRIAQHLRKAASADDSFIGGADLADLMGIKTATEVSSKRALVEKLSRMEKQVPVSSYKVETPKRVSSKCASVLRQMAPAHMFGELVKCGALLDFDAFISLVMGDQVGDVATYAKEASQHTRFMFSSINEDVARCDAVCGNSTYDPNLKLASVLNPYDRTPLVQDFSVDPVFARARLVKRAMLGVEIVKPAAPISAPAQALLDEYAAYKLAALELFTESESIESSNIDEMIMFAVMSS